MIASTKRSNSDLVFKFLSRKVLLIDIKENRNCLKVGYFLRK